MHKDHNQPEFWDKKYINDETDWDTKSANPVFKSILKDHETFPPGKILIMGCGKGYDAITAAQNDFDTVGIDFSFHALAIAKGLAAHDKLNIKFLQQDFFLLDENYYNSFDYIYDYTTLCAIDPSRKNEYARKVFQLLKKGGKFIAILFPVERRESGPPFGLDVVEIFQIFSQYLKLQFYSKSIESIKPRKGREVIQVYVK